MIASVELKAEDLGIVGDVLGYAEPRTDDDAGDAWTVQYVADADIGDTHPMFVGDLFQRREQLLEQCPSAPGVDHVFVFLQGGGVELGWGRLRVSELFLGE